MNSSLNLELLQSEKYLLDLQTELSLNPIELRIISFHTSAQDMILNLLPKIYSILESGGKVQINQIEIFSKRFCLY